MTPDEFVAFADLLPEAMLLVSSDGTILASNRSFLKQLDLQQQDVTDKPLNAFNTGSADALRSYLRICARTRHLVPGSLELRTGSGQTDEYRCEGAVLRPRSATEQAVILLRLIPKKDSVSRFISLNQRLTATQKEVQRRKRAEQLLFEQREWWRTTLSSIGDAIIVTDDQGRVLFLNPVAEVLTGWDQENAHRKPLAEIFHIINEETRKPANNPVDRVLREGVIAGLANHTVLVCRDGTEWTIDDSAAPIRHPDGTIAGVVLVFRDISERREAEEALRESEERFRAIFSQLDVGIVQTDLSGRIVLVNDRYCQIVGYSAEELVQLTYRDITHPDDLDRNEKLFDNALKGDSSFVLEKRYIRKDGSQVWVKNAVSIIQDRFGQPQYSVAMVEDISDRKRLETELQRRLHELAAADRQKNEFLAMLAHELRNPLTPIRSGLDLLTFENGGSHPAIDIMKQQVDHLVRLVDDLLDVSRIVRGKIDLRKEPVSLVDVLNRAIDIARPLIQDNQQQLTTSVPNETIWLDADPVRLAQVIANLLTNAAKYTNPGGHIELSVDPRNGRGVAICVRDNGIGIGPDLLPHVFDLFTQADPSLDRSQGGLGIGLTLVRSLVELHGGSVTAYSEGPNRGSEFTVHLPVLQHTDEQVNGQESEADASSSCRILVVDDNYAAAQLLAMLLGKIADHEIEIANDGVMALELAEASEPHLILLDIGLPHLNGYEVAKRLRAKPAFRDTLIVALTGYGQEEDRQKSRQAGFDIHLTKPPAIEQLRELFRHPKLTNRT